MKKKIGILFNEHKKDILDKTEYLANKLLEYSDIVFIESTENIDNMDIEISPDIIIVLGGDGSVLRCMPFSVKYDIPVKGINFGKFGFLTRFDYDKVIRDISGFLENIKVSKRNLLSVKCHFNDEIVEYNCLNDVVIHKDMKYNVETFDLKINGFKLNSIPCDGVVISTATGSTAYSLSLGGPIIFPDSNSFILNLMSPHTIAYTPLVLSEFDEIHVSPDSSEKNLKISLDGLPWFEVNKIEVNLSGRKFSLACPIEDSYPQIIYEKLLWCRRG